MVKKKKGSASKGRVMPVGVRPRAVVVANTGGTAQPMKPPLENALDGFAKQLRAELDKANAAIAALREEVEQLRTKHNQHTHAYVQPSTGSSGQMWLNLGALKTYFDDEETRYDNWGIYWRGAPAGGNAPESRTGPPSV